MRLPDLFLFSQTGPIRCGEQFDIWRATANHTTSRCRLEEKDASHEASRSLQATRGRTMLIKHTGQTNRCPSRRAAHKTKTAFNVSAQIQALITVIVSPRATCGTSPLPPTGTDLSLLC